MRGGIVLIPRWDVSHCSPLFSPAINQDSNTSCYYDHLLQWERWLPNSLVHWVKKSQLFFFFPFWTVHYVVIFSKTLCSQNTSPYSGIKWVSNNFQANLTKLYGGEDTSFSVRRTIWLGYKMFLFSNHLCSWSERLWESKTFCPTYQPVPC